MADSPKTPTRPAVATAAAGDGEGDVSPGCDEEKALKGVADEARGQLENCMLLFPQWLYAKPADIKDIRPHVATSRGNMSGAALEDLWCSDGQQEKKERRKNMPDYESGYHWREEERDSSLLGRRELRKGDRKTEYRKSDRHPDNLLIREAADPWSLTSAERRSEHSPHNAGNNCRRDSKWSSRWGTEDRDKDSQSGKKAILDKADLHVEKQSLLGAPRVLSESDSHDKWRPRCRQEVRSCDSAVCHATAGLGLERGCVDHSNMAFSSGRGRGSSIMAMPVCKSGSICVPPAGESEPTNGSSVKFADTFQYPRGKLLDIYTRQTRQSSFEAAPKGLSDVPSITLSGSLTPLAFLTPVAAEEDCLHNIWKGKVISSEAHYSSGECTTKAKEGDTDIGGRTAAEKKSAISSDNCTDAVSADCTLGEDKDNPDALISGVDHDSMATLISENDAFYATNVLAGTTSDSTEKLGEKNFLGNNEHVGHSSLGKTLKLEDQSDSILITQKTGLDQNIDKKTKLSEEATLEKLSLFYQDPQGGMQGPFLGLDIIAWLEQGYFGTDLPVRPSDAPESTPFKPLVEIIPHLHLKQQNDPPSPSSASLAAPGNLEPHVPASDISNLVHTTLSQISDTVDLLFKVPSNEDDIFVDHRADIFSQYHSVDIPTIWGSKGQNFYDYAEQETEAVLYNGRSTSSLDKLSVDLPSDPIDLLRSSARNHFTQMSEAHLSDHKGPSCSDMDPRRFSSADLEGSRSKNSLSSTIDHTSGQGFYADPKNVQLRRHRQEQLSKIGETHAVPQDWFANYRRGDVSLIPPDAIGAGKLTHFDAESNYLNLDKNLFPGRQDGQQICSQQLLVKKNMDFPGYFWEQTDANYLNVKDDCSQPIYERAQEQQLLAKQQAMAHQNVDSPGLCVEQTGDSLHYQRAMNQQAPDLGRIKKLLPHERHKPEKRDLVREAHEKYQLHEHQMQLLKQQQQQQQQLLFEQFLHQRFQEADLLIDPNFGALHVDPPQMDFGGALLRQHLLNNSQQWSHYLQQQHDAAAGQLLRARFGHSHHVSQDIFGILSQSEHGHFVPSEQDFLDLQMEQLRAQHSVARQQPHIKEDRRFGGVWPVNELGQFIGAEANCNQVQPVKRSELDVLQPSLRSLSFDLPCNIDQNITLHERMYGECGADSIHRSLGMPSSNSLQNIDHVNALMRFRGLDCQEQQEQHALMHSPDSMGFFASGVHSHNQHKTSEPSASVVDMTEQHWSNSCEQLSNSFLESRFSTMQMEADIQRRDLSVIPSIENTNPLPLLVRNGGAKEDVTKKFALQKFQQKLGFSDGALTPSNGDMDSWLSSQPFAARDQIFYSYDGEEDIAFGEEIVWKRNLSGKSKGRETPSARRVVDQKAIPSEDELAPTPLGKEFKQEGGIASPHGASGTPTSDVNNLRNTPVPSNTNTAAPEPSFAEVLKSSSKSALKPDVAKGFSEAASGAKGSKKKCKRGRQIDPSLLGFKVHRDPTIVV